MRVTSGALAAAIALSSTAGLAWSLIPASTFTQQRHNNAAFVPSGRRRKTVLMSVVPQKKDEVSSAPFFASSAESDSASTHGEKAGRSAEEIANELSLGVTLDGGPVIDFASVKDSTSRAEMALTDARKKYEAALARADPAVGHSSDEGGRLMGINDEVVAEVGYEIGNFVDEYVDSASGETAAELVQKCGTYLRSKAGMGTFPQSWKEGNGNADFTKEDLARFDRLLARAYDESGIVTSAFAKTFYLGTQVLPEPAMKAIWAVYVWCRRTDEIVDAPRPEASDPNAEMLTDLSEWEIRLERLFDRGDVVDVLDLPLLDCKVKYPNLPIAPFSDMIRGMLMDIPGLGQERYDTWDELQLYCYRVAGTVGLMSMPVFGCAPGYTDEMAK